MAPANGKGRRSVPRRVAAGSQRRGFGGKCYKWRNKKAAPEGGCGNFYLEGTFGKSKKSFTSNQKHRNQKPELFERGRERHTPPTTKTIDVPNVVWGTVDAVRRAGGVLRVDESAPAQHPIVG